MKFLFVHQTFPSQFRYLPRYLVSIKQEVRALTVNLNQEIPGVINHVYQRTKECNSGTFPWAVPAEDRVISGYSAAKRAVEMRDKEGFTPDVIFTHTAWGEEMFLRQVWPEAKIIGFFEYFHSPHDLGVGYDPEFPVTEQMRWSVTAKSMGDLLSLNEADVGYCPTVFQKNTYPAWSHSKLSVVHDGIDTDLYRPIEDVSLEVDGLKLTRQDEIITFVTRNMEPLRGFHSFMRALPEVLKRRPNARVLIAGHDSLGGYGPLRKDGQTHKEVYWNEVKDQLDQSRVHFLGTVSQPVVQAIYNLSSVHVYLTYPYFVSWSVLEAMSSGAVVLGSNVASVREHIKDDLNGYLVDMLDPLDVADRIQAILDERGSTRQLALKKLARESMIATVGFTSVCLGRQLSLVDRAFSL